MEEARNANSETEKVEGEIIEVEVGGDLYVKFHKPYKFEGKLYDGVDLSGLENLTMQDQAAIDKQVQRRGFSSRDLLGVTTEHAMHYASLATKLPIEFFKMLPMKDGNRVNATVAGFLLI